ncbi:MAG TPA: B12-binding domain-containing radical SAM protein [Candidatus Margulisiibacteriota bacterium]|nr:B12-binding domain-containing radical SAM protein [Candidatus Margulisiibacteriota bacterium]
MGLASQHVNSLMLPILAVWTERLGWHARVSFAEFADVDYAHPCDVVALSLYTFLAPQGYAVARKFRQQGKLVIIGGPHAKGRLDEVRDHADLVFDRCDESAWCATLRAIESGVIVAARGRGRFVPSAEMTRVPPYRAIKRFYGTGKIPLLLSSLGCPHDCDFCTDWNSTYRKREVDDVIEDVRAIQAPFFIFCDPNFGVNRRFTSELLARMVPLKKKYMMETSLAWLLHDDYLTLLRDSGCIGIELGLESLTTTYGKNGINKRQAALHQIVERIARIKRYIPLIQVNILLGLDNDTAETFRAVADLYGRANIDTLVPFVVTPFPGTPFFDRLRTEGRLFETDWRHFNCAHLVLKPRQLSVPAFYDLYIDLLRQLHAPGLLARKVAAHLRQYRNVKLALILLAFLLARAWNTVRHHLPELRIDKRRAARAAGTGGISESALDPALRPVDAPETMVAS